MLMPEKKMLFAAKNITLGELCAQLLTENSNVRGEPERVPQIDTIDMAEIVEDAHNRAVDCQESCICD